MKLPQLSLARYTIERWWARLRRPTLRQGTIVVFVLGLTWLVLELMLRGGEAAIIADWLLVAVVGALGAVVGVSARERVSMRGEILVGSEFFTLVLLVISILPAIMLFVYGAAMLTSAGVVSLSWVLWGVVLILTIALQLAVYAGLAGVVGVTLSSGVVALFAGVAYVFLVSWAGDAFSDNWKNAWNFAIARWAYARMSLIPEWTFVVQALRGTLAPLDHGRLLSVLASVTVGALAGFAGSILLRVVRQRLMTQVALRRWLPMAAAPLPDSVPLLDARLVTPLVVYALVGWSAVLAWRVL